MSNTLRSLNYYRKLGYVCDKTEHWNHFARKYKDWYGFVDLTAVRDKELLLIQSTAWSQISTRRKKILANTVAPLLLTIEGVRIVVQGWKDKNRSTGKRARWMSKEREVTVEDFRSIT